MEIELFTRNGENLINQIFSVEKEKVETWVIREANGKKYLTHKPEQWKDKALFGLSHDDEKVIIKLMRWDNKVEPNEDIKGYYMGRFTELLLVNFKDKFDKFEIIK